jgi:hypothetical protein
MVMDARYLSSARPSPQAISPSARPQVRPPVGTMRIDQGLQQQHATLLCLPSLFAPVVLVIQLRVTRPSQAPAAPLIARFACEVCFIDLSPVCECTRGRERTPGRIVGYDPPSARGQKFGRAKISGRLARRLHHLACCYVLSQLRHHFSLKTRQPVRCMPNQPSFLCSCTASDHF